MHARKKQHDESISYDAVIDGPRLAGGSAIHGSLALPQSVQFLRQHKREAVEQINLANLEALRKVRDTSENGMAATAAVRQLEITESAMNDQAGGRAAQVAPGVVIVIESPDGPHRATIGPPPLPVMGGRAGEVQAGGLSAWCLHMFIGHLLDTSEA